MPAPDSEDHSRAGAIWVTATGALLLLAAAVVFVAVRWDHLDEKVKLSIVMAAAGGFLAAGRGLRALLPATSSVLYHLGAFLVPVNVAAIAVNQGLGPAGITLAEGLTAAIAFPVLNRTERSIALRWGAILGVIAVAIGLGGTAHLPSPVILAGAALVAEAARRVSDRTTHRAGPADAASITWAVAAGYAPAIALGTSLVQVRPALLDELGLIPADAPWASATAGLLAAIVLGRVAHRRRELVYVVVAAGAAAIGAAASLTTVRPTAGSIWPGAALGFLAVEVGAHLLRRDPFWGRPARWLARGAEAAAVAATLALAAAAGDHLIRSATPSVVDRSAAGIAGVLALAAWLVADQRRRVGTRVPTGIALLVGSGWGPVAPALAITALTAVGWATWSPSALAMTGTGLAVLAVLSGRPWSHAVAVSCAVAGPALASHDPVLAASIGVAGSLSVAWAARLRLLTRVTWAHAGTALLAMAALVPLAVGAAAVVHAGRPLAQVVVVAAPLAWLTALFIDDVAGRIDAEARARRHAAQAAGQAQAQAQAAAWAAPRPTAGAAAPSSVPGSPWAPPGAAGHGNPMHHAAMPPPPLAPRPTHAPTDSLPARWLPWIGRLGAAASLGLAPWLGSVGLVALASSLTVIVVADALRLRRPELLFVAAVTAPVAAVTGGLVSGLSPAACGVVAAGIAVGASIVVTVVRHAWRLPLVSVALSAAATGLVLSAGRADTLGTALLLLGGMATALAVSRAALAPGLVGASAMVVGTWLHLGHASVHASDAYAAPVAALLLAAGVVGRRHRDVVMSSWVAYAPAILTLGTTALLERFDDGDGIHAVVAGTVALAALLAGAARRLSAPLLLGTVLLVAIAWHELLAVQVGVPISFWLAAGGTLLMAAGIALERHDTGPLETGRRLVDTIHERYS